MSQHRSLRAASTLGGKRNVLKRFERTVDGWDEFSKKSVCFPDVAIAVETNHGGIIARLLEREC